MRHNAAHLNICVVYVCICIHELRSQGTCTSLYGRVPTYVQHSG